MEQGAKLMALMGVFIGTLIASNFIAGVKLTNLYGFIVPAGFLAYAVTFAVTDIVDEIYGRKWGHYFVWAGFIANVFALLMIYTAWVMPPLVPGMQVLYEKAFITLPRVIGASMIAYLISQHHDVWAFHKWREATGGKWLWLRNNASTIVSQGIDTVVFITLAFYGVVSNPVLVSMIFSQWMWKVLIALCDTPFVYLGVKVLRNDVE